MNATENTMEMAQDVAATEQVQGGGLLAGLGRVVGFILIVAVVVAIKVGVRMALR